MRKCKLSSPTNNPFEVFSLMYPQDRKYKSNISLFSRNGDNMTYLDKVHPADLSAAIANLTFYRELDYYISANTFAGNCGRSKATLFALNNIVIDLDMHSIDDLYKNDVSDKTDTLQENDDPDEIADWLKNDNLYDKHRWRLQKTDELCHDLLWRLQRDLFRDCMPNVVHLTGRGLQLWWHIEETSKNLLWLYEQVTDNIILLIEMFLQDNLELQSVVEIDYVASRNPAGLVRLFGTYNTKTGRQSTYEIFHRNSYDLNQLKNILNNFEEIQPLSKPEHQHFAKNTHLQNAKDQTKPETAKAPRTRTAQFKRKWIIAQCVAERVDHVGWRNKIIFAAFHNMCLIAPLEEAQEYCLNLNQSFSEPLPSIEHIINHEEHYPFKDVTLCDYLGITKEKYDELSQQYYATHRNDARNILAQERKEEKEQRYAECQRLRNEGYTLAEITRITGVPDRTLRRHTVASSKKLHKQHSSNSNTE